jgi:hypothetical protein
MRAKITTSLGYSLLTVAGLTWAIYAKGAMNLPEVAQLVVLAAGAVSLLLVTRVRPNK